MHLNGLRIVVSAVLLGTTASWVAWGDEGLPTEAVSEAIDVQVVGVDVVVTNKKGVPVRGLKREDFELLVDGEKTEITNFFAAEASGTGLGGTGAGGTGPGGTGPGGTGAGGTGLGGTGPGGIGTSTLSERVPPLHLVLYVDNSSIDAQRRNEALDQFRKFVRSDFSPRDRILLAAANRSSLQPLHAFTDRSEVIEQGLDAIAEMAAYDRGSQELGEILKEIERFVSAGSGYSKVSIESRVRNVESRIRAYSSETHQDTLRATTNLRRLIDTLAGLPGRKAILYLGGSLSLRPGAALNGALSQALGAFPTSTGEEPDSGTPTGSLDDGSDVVQELAEEASVRGVALYAVAAGDLTRSLSLGLSQGAVEVGAGLAPGRQEAWSPGATFSQRMDLRSSLELLARTTGGVAKVDGQGVGSLLERITEDRQTYYSLGFPPPGGADSALRQLEVKVRGRGLQAHYRRAYRARTDDRKAADRTLSALLSGDAESAFEIRLASGDVQPAEDDTYAVPISIQVPVAALALAADGASHTGQVSIFIVTGDGVLTSGPVRKAVFPVTLPNTEILDAMGRVIDYRLELRMRPGSGKIAVTVRDDLDPRLSTETLEVVVGEAVGASR